MRYIFLFLFLSNSSLLVGQDDPQWYSNQLDSNTMLRFDTVAWNSECFNSYSDIFAVYQDATFYLSRNTRDVFLYDNITSDGRRRTKGASVQHNSKLILSLYWTNNYQDDPPPRVVAHHDITNSTNTNILTEGYFIDGEKMVIPTILANHNIVPGRDISIVLNIDSLRDLALLSNVNELYLAYSEIVNASNETIYTSDTDGSLLRLQPVQNNALSLNWPGVSEREGKILIQLDSLNPNSKFIILNFRSKPWLSRFHNINSVCPRGSTVNASSLVFKIEKKGPVVLARRMEKILPAHDPNFINASSYCFEDNSIVFEGQFINEGIGPANELSFDNYFSASLNIIDAKLLNFKIGESPLIMGADVSITNNKITVTLDPSETLSNCELTNCKAGTATFKMKVYFEELSPNIINFIFNDEEPGSVYFNGDDAHEFSNHNSIECIVQDSMTTADWAKIDTSLYKFNKYNCVKIPDCSIISPQPFVNPNPKPRLRPKGYYYWKNKNIKELRDNL